MSEPAQDNPLEQLLELMVYAPVGLLYEYEDVLPQLIRRGKSQVQLARVFGQMAANQQRQGNGRSGAEAAVSGLASMVAKMASEALSCGPEDASEAEVEPTTGVRKPSSAPEAPEAESDDDAAPAADDATALPIANYDALTAREIVSLLPDLTAPQRDQVAAYEQTHRARKTVLGKLERLAG